MGFPHASDKGNGLFSSSPPSLQRKSERRSDDTNGFVNTGVSPTNAPRPPPAKAGTFDEKGHRIAVVRWQNANTAVKAAAALTKGGAFAFAAAAAAAAAANDAPAPEPPPAVAAPQGGSPAVTRFAPSSPRHATFKPPEPTWRQLKLSQQQQGLDLASPRWECTNIVRHPVESSVSPLVSPRSSSTPARRPPGYISSAVLSPRNTREELARFATGTHPAGLR